MRSELHARSIVPRVVMKDLARVRSLHWNRLSVYQAPESWQNYNNSAPPRMYPGTQPGSERVPCGPRRTASDRGGGESRILS